MQLTHYIKDLLYRYDCVMIPRFGAFLAKRQPAKIDESTRVFYPPKKSLSFNRQLKDNDGLLANYIAKTEGISYEQSLHKIYSFVEDLTQALEANGQIPLDSLGLFYTKGDKVLFQPYSHTNYLLEAFGTDAFTSSQIVRQEETEKAPIALTQEQPEDEDLEERRPRTALWKYAAVGVAAIGLGSLLFSGQLTTSTAEYQAQLQIENKIQRATFAINDPLPTVTFNVATKRGKYHIVAGAFRKAKNAKELLQIVKAQGFIHAKYIGENKYGLHEVIYDSFENRDKALTELHKIRQKNNAEAWLLIKKLQ